MNYKQVSVVVSIVFALLSMVYFGQAVVIDVIQWSEGVEKDIKALKQEIKGNERRLKYLSECEYEDKEIIGRFDERIKHLENE